VASNARAYAIRPYDNSRALALLVDTGRYARSCVTIVILILWTA